MQPRFDAPAEHADALPFWSVTLSSTFAGASSWRRMVGRERIVRRRVKRYVDALPDELLGVGDLTGLPGFDALCRSVSPPQPRVARRAPSAPAPAVAEPVAADVDSVVTVVASSVAASGDEKASIAAVPAEPIVSLPAEPDVAVAPVAGVLGGAGTPVLPVMPVVPVMPSQVAMRTTRSTAPKPA